MVLRSSCCTVENKLDLKDFYHINVNQGYKSQLQYTHYPLIIGFLHPFLLELRYCQQTIKDLLLKVAEQYTFYKKGSHKLWCIHSYMHIIRSTILSSKVNSLLYYKIIWRHMRFLFNYLFCDFKMRMQDKFLHQHYFQ